MSGDRTIFDSKDKKDFEVKEAVENHLEICIEGDNCDNE